MSSEQTVLRACHYCAQHGKGGHDSFDTSDIRPDPDCLCCLETLVGGCWKGRYVLESPDGEFWWEQEIVDLLGDGFHT